MLMGLLWALHCLSTATDCPVSPARISGDGNYMDCVFHDRPDSTTVSSSGTFLLRCQFIDIHSGSQGGAFRIQGILHANDTLWFNCSSSVGGGGAIQTFGTYFGQGFLSNCNFTSCFRQGSGQFSTNPHYGGALALMGGAECICTKCHFISNLDGGISVVGSLWCTNCEFDENGGNFGGIYVTGSTDANTISLSGCTFVANAGTVSGGSLHLDSPITLLCNDCLFSFYSTPSIYTKSGSSITFGSNCFNGDGPSFDGDSVVITVQGRLCFEKSVPDSVSFLGPGTVFDHCSDCLPTPSRTRSYHSCSSVSGDGYYVGCNIPARAPPATISGIVTLIRCKFNNINSGSQGGTFRLASGVLNAADSLWSGCSASFGTGFALESCQGFLTNCNFTGCYRQTNGGQEFTEGKYGGAIGLRLKADCTCTNCNFDQNQGGGISMDGSLWCTHCTFTSNSGYFGAIFVVGTNTSDTLSLSGCTFAGNGGRVDGAMEGCSIHLASSISFSCTGCSFAFYLNTSIYFTVGSSLTFGSNCFTGDGPYLGGHSVDITVDGILCFETSIPTSVTFSGPGTVLGNCSDCWNPNLTRPETPTLYFTSYFQVFRKHILIKTSRFMYILLWPRIGP
jgi:hypothetical protein